MNWTDGSTYDVGIDIGKRRLAYAWPTYRLAECIDLGKPGMRRDQELRMMRDWLRTKLPCGVQLWVDQPLSHVGTEAFEGQAQTVAAVLTAVDWVNQPQMVYAATWKAQVIGNHRASKDEIRDWLWANYPQLWEVCQTEDEFDAMAIGLYGKKRSDGEILPPDVKTPKGRARA